ncbi:MAG: type II secretion system secretin GspD [Burkholderiaceae bacterium]|nr:type II secretion system secretin GspD [Burkholderiaceae bacterium]MEB2317687.1 type II secretion system secretin GspD [Pseudomonadota bacterium]
MTVIHRASPIRCTAHRRLARGLLLTLVALVLALPAPGPVRAQNGEGITLNFRDADVDSVIGAFGHLLDRTFIIDPRVRGKLTLETPGPVSKAHAYQMLQSALRVQGFAIVDSGGLSKVVPEAEAKLQSGPVTAGRQPASGGDQVVTQIFRLNYESATNLVPVLRPLIAPNNTINAYPNNNSLVITDYAGNLERLARIIATLDNPSTRQVEVVPVRHAIASDVAVAVNHLLGGAAGPGGGQGGAAQAAGPGASDPGQRVIVLADPRTNSILVRASSVANVRLAKSLIGQLDQPEANGGNVHVVYLRNAEATKLARTLSGVLGGQGGQGSTTVQDSIGQASTMMGDTGMAPGSGSFPGSGGTSSIQTTPLSNGSGQAGGPVAVRAGGAIIAADPSTNSLIITAPDPVYRNLRKVIDQLDVRRAQVYIESLIVEVNAETAAELGIQWQFLDAPDGRTRAIGGTNFNNLDGTGSIIGATTDITSAGGGLNLGIVRGRTNVTIGGVEVPVLNLGLLARALESGGQANVLATPNLLTLDNEEARIIIGQNVPFVTGQYTNTGAGQGAVSPFQTIERQDVGTTLRVRPQVSESGTVKLQIFQEVSSVQSTQLAAGIVTNKRSIESNVLVDDGQVIVLGGLIEERIEGGEDKVPGLGDVPLLGQLFRYDSRKRVKTNLLVFLRPVIVRDQAAAHDVTLGRYDYIRHLRGDGGLPEHWALPQMGGQVLPPLGPRPGPDGQVPPNSGPQSLSPDLDRAAEQRRRAEQQLREGVVRHAPNEVVVPLGTDRQFSAPDAASRSGAGEPQPDRSVPGRPGGRGPAPANSPLFGDPTFPMLN